MRLALVLCLLAPLADAQSRVYTVGGTAPDFPDLEAAVEAAEDGDVLLVRAGSHPAFELAGKGLSILFEVDPGLSTEARVTDGRVLVRDVPAGSRVTFVGLTLRRGLSVVDCQGAVLLQHVVLGDSGLGTTVRLDEAALVVEGSREVLLHGVRIGGLLETDALALVRSTCHAWQSEILGGQGADGGSPGTGALGVHAVDSTLHLAETLVRGGGGGSSTDPIRCMGGDGGAGLRQEGATAVTRSRDGQIAGGRAGSSAPGCPFLAAPGEPFVLAGGTLELRTEAQPIRSLVLPAFLREGEPVRLLASGEPDGAVFWIGTLGTRTVLSSLVTGPLIDPAPPELRYLGRANPSGLAQASLGTVPHLGGIEGVQVFSQVVFLRAGTLRATHPVASVLLDGRF